MKKHWPAGPILLLSLLLGFGHSAQAEIRTGMWENTITSKVDGMPFSPPPQTFTECLTQDDLTPNLSPADQECEVIDHQVKGSQVNWQVKCDKEGIHSHVLGQITYQGDAYQGEMAITLSGGPMGEMKMTQTLSGRRLGDCQ